MGDREVVGIISLVETIARPNILRYQIVDIKCIFIIR
jgi:hypothetical protein